MNKGILKAFAALLFTMVLLSSCRKEKEELIDSITSAQDNSRAMYYWDDIYKTIDEQASSADGIRSGAMNACIDTVIVDTTAMPMTILIDFGQDDCSGLDGRVRKGQLSVSFTGRYREVGTTITTTPINYTIDGHLVQGTKTVTNQGPNDDGHPVFSVVVSGASVTAPDAAWTASWESTRTRTWKEGYESVGLFDDVYEITGGQTGVNRNGTSYSATILTPLRIEIGCPWIVSGVYELIPNGLSTRTVDFGSGACDPYVSVSVNGNTYNFSL